MSGLEVHRKGLAEHLRLEDAPAIVTRVLRKTEIGVIETRSDNPQSVQSGSLPHEDAYVVFLMNTPFHALNFHLSRAVFDAIADDTNAPRIGELDYQPGVSIDDKIIRDLGTMLLGGFTHPERVNRMFLDHVTLAAAAHVAQIYGGMRVAAARAKGGLAPWQLRRATELLAAHLDGSVALKMLADACGLSTSYFARAFRTSTGLAPHQWLTHRRVEAAKDLLRQRRSPLREIALACGFFDQSHFTNVFTRIIGTSPRTWQRNFDE